MHGQISAHVGTLLVHMHVDQISHGHRSDSQESLETLIRTEVGHFTKTNNPTGDSLSFRGFTNKPEFELEIVTHMQIDRYNKNLVLDEVMYIHMNILCIF